MVVGRGSISLSFYMGSGLKGESVLVLSSNSDLKIHFKTNFYYYAPCPWLLFLFFFECNNRSSIDVVCFE